MRNMREDQKYQIKESKNKKEVNLPFFLFLQ